MLNVSTLHLGLRRVESVHLSFTNLPASINKVQCFVLFSCVQGMAGHMQIFALSEFLAVSLPIEYIETARGLRWLVPHVTTPWQSNADANNFTNFGTNVSPADVAVRLRRRSLLVAPAVSDSDAPARLDSSLQPLPSQFTHSYIFKWHKQQVSLSLFIILVDSV